MKTYIYSQTHEIIAKVVIPDVTRADYGSVNAFVDNYFLPNHKDIAEIYGHHDREYNPDNNTWDITIYCKGGTLTERVEDVEEQNNEPQSEEE